MSTQTMVGMAQELGFSHAVGEIERLETLAKKLAQAYEHYRYVSQEKFTAFNNDLLHKTYKREHPYMDATYDNLRTRSIETYPGIPPKEVLSALRLAKDRGIFDGFEIADIETVRVVADPILFGRIDGSTDRFFIAQWGHDVSISDILGEHDG